MAECRKFWNDEIYQLCYDAKFDYRIEIKVEMSVGMWEGGKVTIDKNKIV